MSGTEEAGERSRTIAHGGDLDAAQVLFPHSEQPWIDLSTGINPVPYPCPPMEASAFRRLPSRADLHALLAAAARAYGVADPDQVVAAPGTQILIETLPRLRPHSRVAVIGPTYAEHEAAWLRGGHAVTMVGDPAQAGEVDVVVVVNPNNPDGRTWEASALLDLAGRLARRGGWLVVDEAFIDLESVESLAPRVERGLIVLRSFGKTYGLAGIRLGFALTEPALARRIAQALGPWAVPGPALALGRSALADTPWLREAALARHADALRLDRLLACRGGRVVGGTCLFRTAAFDDAPDLFRRLGEAGIYVRRFEAIPHWLRFGLPADKGEWCRLSRVLKPV
ncbi:threonine-phosphate decarboxylase CobD [Methylobacterium sp. E-045]|uniref:threonine-phosphate decarboxylase CobD n=1 Tax=Methylobacterium sp. E-045 TaxID=2836575 RepID=UPI001FBBD2DB|nr:threonine-phosphate decarboxylase CobD [Methylobacterium sp. E-045]MCJ2130045.1 threonine-phosphate decarboxylase CobD [Methylobacterium sp. E-045]